MRLMVLNGVLLAAAALAIVGGQLLDRDGPAVELAVRRYAIAVSNSDLDGAMAQIAPEARAAWTDWVRSQLGNVYEVRGIAVRSHSIAERTVNSRTQGGPFEVTAVMDVNRAFPDDFYQPTTKVQVEEVEGQWYLATPLLAKP